MIGIDPFFSYLFSISRIRILFGEWIKVENDLPIRINSTSLDTQSINNDNIDFDKRCICAMRFEFRFKSLTH